MQLSPERVKAAREVANLSQRAVAAAAGVSIDTVRRAENGLHEPGANALGRISAALGVTIDSLFVHDPDADTPATAGEESTPNSHGDPAAAGTRSRVPAHQGG